MKTLSIASGALAALILAGLLAGPAYAADITQFPSVGAPGDPVVLKGDFDDDPVVKFGGVEADVVRTVAGRILCLVPDDAKAGEVDLTVDGTATAEKFLVVAKGTPIVLRLSADTATPGMRIYLVGRRLGGGTASFVDSTGTTQAEVDLKGRRHAAALVIPDDLDAGDYTLVVENGDGLDTGDASPEIEIVASDTPELSSVSPDGALPGDHVKLSGTDLGPAGPVKVEWEDSSGETLRAPGFSNGYDTIHSFVPFGATAGATYEIVVVLRGGQETSGVVKFEVGSYGKPSLDSIDPAKGPAGSLAKLSGANLLVLGAKPVVRFAKGGETWRAPIVGAMPAFGDRKDVLAIQVPRDLADGDYAVTVTVGDATSGSVTFTVGALDLSVTGMRPDHQGTKGTIRPVEIKGTGFGHHRDGSDLKVVWDDGAKEYAGRVIFRTDRVLLVIPPGDIRDPLPSGKYDVKVILDPDGTPDSESAGTYTVTQA